MAVYKQAPPVTEYEIYFVIHLCTIDCCIGRPLDPRALRSTKGKSCTRQTLTVLVLPRFSKSSFGNAIITGADRTAVTTWTSVRFTFRYDPYFHLLSTYLLYAGTLSRIGRTPRRDFIPTIPTMLTMIGPLQ